METLFNAWAKRDAFFERRFQESVIEVFCDYGKGVSSYNESRGKTFGAGYEIYIIAFFIGLYHNQEKPLVDDPAKIKKFGQPIMYWGNIENRMGRQSYHGLVRYMFAALVARTDIDFIALDKGEITVKAAVDKLVEKMERYANYGLDYISDHLENNPNYYFREGAFLGEFTSLLHSDDEVGVEDDAPEPLD